VVEVGGGSVGVAGPAVAAASGVGCVPAVPSPSIVARFFANWSTSLPETSLMTPPPIAAALPLSLTSVSIVPRVLPFSLVSAICTCASALP
jgi:hypothetical protein